MNPVVSVIIPTHKGAEKQTERCVQSVKQSNYKHIQLIVINEGFERSRQRNLGIERANGQYLLFLDSDMYIHPFLIDECITLLEVYDALYIPEIITTKGFFGRFRNWDRHFFIGTVIDVPRFVRAKDCPNFDIELSGPEDAAWDRRGVWRRGLTEFPLYHDDNVGVLGYLKKKAYYSKSMRRYAEKWKNDKAIDFWYRCIGVYTENGKWRLLIKKPHYTVALWVLLLIRGIIYHIYK